MSSSSTETSSGEHPLNCPCDICVQTREGNLKSSEDPKEIAESTESVDISQINPFSVSKPKDAVSGLYKVCYIMLEVKSLTYYRVIGSWEYSKRCRWRDSCPYWSSHPSNLFRFFVVHK